LTVLSGYAPYGLVTDPAVFDLVTTTVSSALGAATTNR